jgi:polyisoprenyl-phosphate glycosyltransferase
MTSPSTERARNKKLIKSPGNYDLDIVIPIYNEEMNLPILIKELETVCSQLAIQVRIILIDDGSNDNSWMTIESLIKKRKTLNVVGVRLKRNYGQMHAFDCGINLTSADFVVTMDADLQHPPGFIKELWENRSSQHCVAARQLKRKDRFLKKILSTLFYPLISILTKVDIATNVSDFRIIPRGLLLQILEVNDSPRILRFLIPKLGINQIYLDYQPAERLHGSSKYNLRKMYKFATYSLITTTNNLLRVSLKASLMYAFFTMAVFVYGLSIMLSGNGIPGYLSILFTLTVSFTGLFLILGIFGLYLEKLLDLASRLRVDSYSKIEEIIGE